MPEKLLRNAKFFTCCNQFLRVVMTLVVFETFRRMCGIFPVSLIEPTPEALSGKQVLPHYYF